MSRQPDPSPPTMPYDSAKDLPSYQELLRLVQGAKLVTLVFARQEREKILEIEREIDRLVRVVDDFYARLGPRNWIFHDPLSVDEVETILAETSDQETAEERFIELYRDGEKTKWWLMRFTGQDGHRERFHQIERAREHYFADQFDSCVLQLIAVMDGFVNDFEPAVRKGLSARDPSEMTVWDSVVGHHMGLTNVMTTFTKTIKKRVDEEVFDLYRHGIMHGTVVRFDNLIVATKAWNMLFAVSDWAKATQRANEPPKTAPSLSDTWSTLKQRAAYRHCRDEFVPSTLIAADPGFKDDEVVVRASEFLDAWLHKRWGLVAAFTPAILVGSKSEGELARFAKDVFERYALTSWAISAVTRDMASGSNIGASVTLNDKTTEIRFRMILQTPDAHVAMPSDDGAAWRLAVWSPDSFFPETA